MPNGLYFVHLKPKGPFIGPAPYVEDQKHKAQLAKAGQLKRRGPSKYGPVVGHPNILDQEF